MPVKAIYDLEIDQSAFDRFTKSFEKYNDALTKTPKIWDKVTETAGNAALDMKGMAAALLAQAQFAHDLNTQQEKAGRGAADQARSWRDIGRSTRTAAQHILSATRSLLQWGAITGVVSGLLGAGGLWGISGLAISAGNQRRSGLGLGVTPGQQQAFGLAFGRVTDPNHFLGGVEESLTDPTKRGALYAAGLSTRDIDGHDNAEVSLSLMRQIKKLADQTNENMLGSVFKSRQLGQFISEDDFRRIKRTPAGEMADYARRFQTDAKGLDLTPGQQKAWQDLQVQLDRAGKMIEQTFITGLSGIVPEITDLSNTIIKLTVDFFKSGAAAELVHELGDAIKWLNDELKSPEFKKGVEDFVSDIVVLSKAIAAAIHWLVTPSAPMTTGPGLDQDGGSYLLPQSYHPGVPSPVAPMNASYTMPGGGPAASYSNTPGTPVSMPPGGADFGDPKQAHDFFRSQGWSENETDGILSYINGESRYKLSAFNGAGGGQGAQGIGQWRGARVDQFRKMFGHDPRGAPFIEQLKFIQWELMNTERGAAARLHATHTAGEAGAAFTKYYGRPAANEADALMRQRAGTAEGYRQQYGGVSVQIHNNTGGNAIVTTSQLSVGT